VRGALRRAWPFGSVVLFLIVLSQLVWAHAILMDSTPKANSTVKGPEVAIHLRFNVRVDGSRSRLHLVSPGGASVALVSTQPKPDTLESHAAGLKPGAYKLQWQVLASDGHISRGEVPFAVE